MFPLESRRAVSLYIILVLTGIHVIVFYFHTLILQMSMLTTMEHPTCTPSPPPACPASMTPSLGGLGQCMVSPQSLSLALPPLCRLGSHSTRLRVSCAQGCSGRFLSSQPGHQPGAQVTIVQDSECQASMSQYNRSIGGSMLCAGGEGQGPCQVTAITCVVITVSSVSCHQTDSGGPLTVEEEDGHTLVGVVSHGARGDCEKVSLVRSLLWLSLFTRIMLMEPTTSTPRSPPMFPG